MKIENTKEATYLISKLDRLNEQKKDIEKHSHPYRFNTTFYCNSINNADITIENKELAEHFKSEIIRYIDLEILEIKKQIKKL